MLVVLEFPVRSAESLVSSLLAKEFPGKGESELQETWKKALGF